MFPAFTSSAIENIDLNDNIVTITFNGGRSYDYSVNDVTNFVTSLTDVITEGKSVGRFVNQRIKDDTLSVIAA
jgi:hypothetical protein